jgi:hypothetical protein
MNDLDNLSTLAEELEAAVQGIDSFEKFDWLQGQLHDIHRLVESTKFSLAKILPSLVD